MHNVPPHQPVFYLFNEIPDLHGDSIEGYIDINSDTDYLEEFTGLFDQYEKISDYRFDTNKYKKFHEIFKVNIPSIPDLFTIDESFEDSNFIKLTTSKKQIQNLQKMSINIQEDILNDNKASIKNGNFVEFGLTDIKNQSLYYIYNVIFNNDVHKGVVIIIDEAEDSIDLDDYYKNNLTFMNYIVSNFKKHNKTDYYMPKFIGEYF